MKRNTAFENYVWEGVYTAEAYNEYIEDQQRQERKEAEKKQ